MLLLKAACLLPGLIAAGYGFSWALEGGKKGEKKTKPEKRVALFFSSFLGALALALSTVYAALL